MAEAEGATALALRTGAFERLARFSRVRGKTPILYGSIEEDRVRQACLLWGVHPRKLDAGVENWYRALMKASGLEGRVAYARWAGDDARFAWEIGVGKGLDGKPITGV
jgi:pyruvate kinase